MAKTARLELRVTPEFKARVEAECERRGMKVATFVERAVEARLAPVESVIVRAQAGEFERAAKPAPVVPFAGYPPQVDGLVKREQRAAEKAKPAVFDARAAALERQRRLNEGKS